MTGALMPRWVRERTVVAAVILVLAAIGAGLWWNRSGSAAPQGPAAPAVPVSVATAVRADVPHLSTTIGTAQALNSVVIRSQIDGTLTRILFREGDTVRRGDLLATIDDRTARATLESARAEKLRADAELAAATLDLTRYADVVARGAVSKQALDQQQALVLQMQASVRAGAAAVAAAEVALDHTRITAPIGGRVGIRRVDAGNFIRQSDPDGLVTVTQMAPVAVVFALPQDLLPRLRALGDDAVGAPVTAYDRVGGDLLGAGVVSTLDNAVDAGTGTIRMKAQFPNTDGRLWPGQFVTVEVRTGLSAGGLTIPSKALLRGREQPFVYRVEQGAVAAVPVTVEYENEDVAVIGAGLAAGDLVVSDGQSRLQPGARVKVVAAPGEAPPT